MAKVTLKELKKMIREAVREQVSGLPSSTPQRRGYMGGTAGRPQRMGAMKAPPKGTDIQKFNLDELVAMLKDNENLDPAAKKKIKNRITAILKQAGW